MWVREQLGPEEMNVYARRLALPIRRWGTEYFAQLHECQKTEILGAAVFDGEYIVGVGARVHTE